MDPMIDISEESSDLMNGDVASGSKSPDQLTDVGVIAVDARVKRKAKRLLKHHSSNSGHDVNVVSVSRNWKNSRKSRNGYRRGLPKKGGAGGKGVWGKLGMESDDIVDTDKNDPNYESDTLDDDIQFKCVFPELTDEELKKNLELIILEYYENGDTEEAVFSIDELNCSTKKWMIPQQAIEMAMEHKPSHREMTSVLLSDLAVHIIRPKAMITAFNHLLSSLQDLILDTPDATDILGCFIARAIADQCMKVTALDIFRQNNPDKFAKSAICKAETLLGAEFGLYKLDNVWGIGGGLRPVKTLVRQMNMLLEEYLCAGDIQEATRCLLELEVPHFHHELVYEAVVLTLESLNSEVEEAMCSLLKSLADAIIITPDMMNRGFLRVYEDLPDIIIDVPLAHTILERFVEQCFKAGFLDEDIVKKIPMRGRKRFVSEGDGGKIKERQ